MLDIGATIDSLGWRQGSIVPVEMYKSLGLDIEGHKNHIFIVITQSCDLINPRIDLEPFVELMLAKPIDQEDGNYTEGKNPRFFDISLYDEGKWYRLFFHDKCRKNRSLLLEYPPADNEISEEKTIKIANWVGRKYSRLALPNEFNNRYRAVAGIIKKAIKDTHTHISQIYIGLNTFRELKRGNYRGLMQLVVTDETYIDMEAMREVNEAISKIEKAFISCNGLTLDVAVLPESQISLQEANTLRRWDTLDYLSPDQ